MGLPQAKIDATEARLAGLRLPEMAGWARAAHEDAVQRLRAMGLPGRRDEYWRFTDPAALNAPDPMPAAVFTDDEAPLFAGVDRLRLVFVDGVFDAAASDPLAGEGLEIERLADAMTRDIHWARDLYGVLEARGQP